MIHSFAQATPEIGRSKNKNKNSALSGLVLKRSESAGGERRGASARSRKGERPLGYPLWKATSDYLARKRKEREIAQRPLRVELGSGGRRVLWRREANP
jgi:hypothetical protein